MTRDEEKIIEYKLSQYLGTCQCQRKLKSIFNSLESIRAKILDDDRNLSGEQILLIAFLDAKDLITHGTNVEYPILNNPEFWNWVSQIYASPDLKDN